MNIDMIRAAAVRGAGHVRETPLLSAPGLDAMAGRRVFVKAECLQWTGSFKFRGGWSAVSALAVRKITGVSCSKASARTMRSSCTPVSSGIMTSRMIRSGRKSRARPIARSGSLSARTA